MFVTVLFIGLYNVLRLCVLGGGSWNGGTVFFPHDNLYFKFFINACIIHRKRQRYELYVQYMEIYDKTQSSLLTQRKRTRPKKKKEKEKEINFVLEFLPFHVLVLLERIIIEKQLVLWLNTMWFIAHFMIRSKRCQTLVQW